jgi:hypothetical protein
MADQRKNGTQEAKSLENSISSGRITATEAETIRSFFASKPAVQWPATEMQKRMQSSGG